METKKFVVTTEATYINHYVIEASDSEQAEEIWEQIRLDPASQQVLREELIETRGVV